MSQRGEDAKNDDANKSRPTNNLSFCKPSATIIKPPTRRREERTVPTNGRTTVALPQPQSPTCWAASTQSSSSSNEPPPEAGTDLATSSSVEAGPLPSAEITTRMDNNNNLKDSADTPPPPHSNQKLSSRPPSSQPGVAFVARTSMNMNSDNKQPDGRLPQYKDQVRDPRAARAATAVPTTSSRDTEAGDQPDVDHHEEFSNTRRPLYKDQVRRVADPAHSARDGTAKKNPNRDQQTWNNEDTSTLAAHRENWDVSTPPSHNNDTNHDYLVNAVVVTDDNLNDQEQHNNRNNHNRSFHEVVTAERLQSILTRPLCWMGMVLALLVTAGVATGVVLLLIEQQPEPSDSSNGNDNFNSTNRTEESPPTMLPTLVPENWIPLGQQVFIGSEDVARTVVATSRNGMSFVIGAPSGDWIHADVYTFQHGTFALVASIPRDGYGATGHAVAMNDAATRIAIGSPWLDDNTDAYYYNEVTSQYQNATGRVRVYQIMDHSTVDSVVEDYEQAAIQLGSDIFGYGDAPSSSEFGWSVDLSADGNIVAIGSRKQCQVRVLQYNSTDWVDLGQRIECSDDDEGNNMDNSFGAAVSLSSDGTVLAVGEPGRYSPQENAFQEEVDSSAALFRGRVRVYRLQDNEWQILGQILEGEAAQDAFGTSLALSTSTSGNGEVDGMVLAVGSPYNDVGRSPIEAIDTEQDPALGSCRLFQYNATVNMWIQLGSDLDGEALFDYFGTAVSVSANGRVVAVGATGSNENGDDSGQVRVFEYQAEQNSWDPVGPTIAGPFAFAEAGMSLALSANGELIIVAMSTTSVSGSDRKGAAQVFETGVTPRNGDFPIQLILEAGDYLDMISWSLERLDVERYTIVASEAIDFAFQDGNGTFVRDMRIVEGAVYRFTLSIVAYEQNFAWIIKGLSELDGTAISGQGNGTSAFQTNFLAANSTKEKGDPEKSPILLSLTINVGESPSDISWVLLTSAVVTLQGQMTHKRNVLAFGPRQTAYDSKLVNGTLTDTIEVSAGSAGETLQFFFTDASRSGTSSYQLLVVSTTDIDEDLVIAGNPGDERRETKTFTLER